MGQRHRVWGVVMTMYAAGARVIVVTLTLATVLALAYACGGDDGTSESPEPTLAGGTGSGGSEVKTEVFDVTMGDNFFDPAEVTVSGGALAKINLVNVGTAIHNMRISGADKEYNTTDDAVSDPPLVNGGEPAALRWNAPSIGGSFAFRCDFHPEIMAGTISAEPATDQGEAGEEGP